MEKHSYFQLSTKRLFVDMDGTLARFHDQVQYLERMYEKGFFRNLEPFENMIAAIKIFIKEYPDVEVNILSAKVIGEPPYCEEEKNAWLNQYLPEIDQAHRIFTEIGKSKASYIRGGLSEHDFLLDDYNRGLNQFLSDGGQALKCHNNINQHGSGSYGGEAGHVWIGPMVHIDDKPELIAAELASHMGLSYDLNRVAAAYSIDYVSSSQSKAHTYPILRATETAPNLYYAEPAEGISIAFKNPLNALRYLNGKSEFREEFIETTHSGPSGTQRLSVTRAQLSDINFNLGLSRDFTSNMEDPSWCEKVVEILSKRPAGQIHAQQAQIVPSTADSPIFLFEENRSQNRMGCPNDFKNVYFNNWFEYYSIGDNNEPYHVDCILEFTPKNTPWSPENEMRAKNKMYEAFRQNHPGRQIVVLELAYSVHEDERRSEMDSAIRKYRNGEKALNVLPPYPSYLKIADDPSPSSKFASFEALSSDATMRANTQNTSQIPSPERFTSREKENDTK